MGFLWVSGLSIITASTSPPHISLINAPAYVRAARLQGSVVFQMSLRSATMSGKAVHPNTVPAVDLSNVPEEYHEFVDVFSKKKADTLPSHCSYDLKIELEEGASPPPRHMYSLSPMELEALQVFIDENLSNSFIRPSNSPHGAPILFVKKKSRELWLCVDYRGLNRILKKDRYP